MMNGVYLQSKLSVPNKMWVGIAAAVFLQPLHGHTPLGVVPLFMGMSIAMDGIVVSAGIMYTEWWPYPYDSDLVT